MHIKIACYIKKYPRGYVSGRIRTVTAVQRCIDGPYSSLNQVICATLRMGMCYCIKHCNQSRRDGSYDVA